jgi:hypothetical protein
MHTADAQRRTAAVNGRVVCGLAKGRLLLDNFEQMEATAPPEHARCGDVVTHLREMDRFDPCTLNMHSKGNKPSERLDGGMPAYVCFAVGMCPCASLTRRLAKQCTRKLKGQHAVRERALRVSSSCQQLQAPCGAPTGILEAKSSDSDAVGAKTRSTDIERQGLAYAPGRPGSDVLRFFGLLL